MNGSSPSSLIDCSTSASAIPGSTAAHIGVPVEIVSEEEMAFVEAALASTRPLLYSSSSTLAKSSSSSSFARLSSLPPVLSPFQRPCSSLRSSDGTSRTPLAASTSEIEDSASTPRPSGSLLQQFRSRRALAVTDITATEWCEKQMEFALIHGKPKRTEAMIAGTNRHLQLENEVVEKVELEIASIEESWALKMMNFIVGANQLLFEGLTRELPVIGVIEGVWMIGVIDELRMPKDDVFLRPYLVDTKTRQKATVPSEAQKRNARLQLMCYKYLWDNLVCESFAKEHFLGYFGLNHMYVLSGDIKKYIASLGFDVKTFEDVLTYFENTCSLLSPSQEQLCLRYELQSDQSLLEEHCFPYNVGWLREQIQECLKFWTGEREARFASGDERWKCQFCAFRVMCPTTANSNNTANI